MDRKQMADLIYQQLSLHKKELKAMFASSQQGIGYFFIDDVLPVDIAEKIYKCFPSSKTMRLKKSLKQYKFIAAQMNEYDPILEEAVYAFQDSRIVDIISEVCNLQDVYPDVNLYAGGVSMMSDKHFLNPHIDNSHDKDRNRWRVLNLLYYVTPDWALENGGNLELWPDGLGEKQITLHSKFNRLIVMATHDSAWHSVSPISSRDVNRCCVSNYYFADHALKQGEQFHVTSFRGRPEQRIRDLVLRADIAARMAVRKLFKKGLVENKHVYKRR